MDSSITAAGDCWFISQGEENRRAETDTRKELGGKSAGELSRELRATARERMRQALKRVGWKMRRADQSEAMREDLWESESDVAEVKGDLQKRKKSLTEPVEVT